MRLALDAVSPALLEAVIAQAPDAMIYADRGGTIVLWNQAAERLFGHSAAEATGSSLDIIIPERLREGHWRGYRQAIESGQTRHAGRVMTTKALHRSGSTLYVDFSFGLIRDAAGEIAGALAAGRLNPERNRPSKP